jgi:DNA-binding transcriptional ArsR family regulator
MKKQQIKSSRMWKAEIKRRLTAVSIFDETAVMMSLASSPVRLKILLILDTRGETRGSDLSKILGLSETAISQNFAKLRIRGLVAGRRDAQSIYYRLGAHPFVAALQKIFLRELADLRRSAG